MGKLNVEPRTIFHHDNLDILRGMNSECVDLIYLDPPFNKNKVFTAPMGSSAEGAEFSDIFREEDIKDEWVKSIEFEDPELYAYLQGVKTFSNNYNYCYLVYMAIRLIECRRLLKDSGSLYLHCDPTMSHYLKIVLDCIFGEKNGLNEITWKRYASHDLKSKGFDTITDKIFFYAKDINHMVFHPQYGDTDESKFSHLEEETGRYYQHIALEQSSNRGSAGETRKIGDRVVTSKIGWRWSQETFDERLKENPHIIHWTGTGRPRYKKYLDDYLGKPIANLWTDVAPLSSGASERTGYPTQKPIALLERIIKASSNPGDLVLDPFCGCATTCVAAEKWGRQWLGVDVAYQAFEEVNKRMEKLYAKQGSGAITAPLLSGGYVKAHYTTKVPKRGSGAEEQEQGYVYIISNDNWKGLFKVGIAKDPKRRLNTFQTSDPYRAYKLRYSHKTPHYKEIEQHIHKEFNAANEWVEGTLEKIKKAIQKKDKSM